MPDSKKNQKKYPQPSGQKEGCGFPVMRIVAVFSLVTGFILAYRKSSLNHHEVMLWKKMWNCFEKGDVVLGDRAYCSFAAYWLLMKKGIDSVMRLHQRRKGKIIKKFSKNDYLVSWSRGNGSSRPKWMSLNQWKKIPDELMVRYVEAKVNIPGFRTKALTVATTLLDNKKYPADKLAELYRRRWMAELFLRDIKTTLRMEILRCKTPEMIHKEMAMFVIAYNLIRSLIWEAALENGTDPYRISFKGAVAAIRQWAPMIAMTKATKEKEESIIVLKEIIAADKIPIRKIQRREPRAIKRRQNATYQLLTKPRNEFVEIQHRHRYTKDRKMKIKS
jgi:hypothetical protein